MKKGMGILGSILVSFAVTMTGIASLSRAEDGVITVKADGKRKINLSGRQRMLSQYMAKAVCFAALKVDTDKQLNEMKLAHYLFDRTLTDLRDGSPVAQMLPETDPTIIAALAEVRTLWDRYGKAVMNRELLPVVEQNLAVLTKANDAVTLFQAKYGATDIAPEIATAINIAGRQRMLTQKASKEFCLIAAGIDAAANRTNLKATIALFQASASGLRDSNPKMGLKNAPNIEIRTQLNRVSIAWEPMYEIFSKVAGGAQPSDGDVEIVSTQNVAVMEAANKTVSLYESTTN